MFLLLSEREARKWRKLGSGTHKLVHQYRKEKMSAK